MAISIRRRELVLALGGVAAAWPIAARAQQAGKLPTIGYLGGTTYSVEGPWAATFVQRLRELGWIEGRNFAIEYGWTEGRPDRAAEIVAEFVRMKVDVIVTSGTGQIIAAMKATSVIPIVFAAAGDPVGSGLVASLARPGGNVTGLSLLATDLAGKRIEFLREVVPGLRRLGIMGNSSNPLVVREIGETEQAARTLGLDFVTSRISRPEDIAPAFESLDGRADALFIVLDTFINTNRLSIVTLSARLPTMHGLRELVVAGGLMSYATNFPDLWRRAAGMVDKILHGSKPSDIPVEQPVKFDLVINLKTARAMGLTIPEALLLRADEVIE
jgi:putative tryptophan/tyrosine transport system substrate-binding protein